MLLFTAVIVAPPGRSRPLMGAPASKAVVKFPPEQLIVVEWALQPHPGTDIGDVEIVSCAGELAVLEAFCAHFSNTSVAAAPKPLEFCTKASCEPSAENVTELLIVPPFVLYA